MRSWPATSGTRFQTPFLDRLAAAGVAPDDVDVVVNTHIHYDHVGWNTRLDGDTWVPTFPNATYLIPRIDREYFDPENEHRRPSPTSDGDRLRRRDSHLVFADSVAPVLEHARLWEGEHEIDANLTLAAAPGHTPGSSVLHLRWAVFVGDILHSPAQLHVPDANSCFCEDAAGARATRRRVLEQAAERRGEEAGSAMRSGVGGCPVEHALREQLGGVSRVGLMRWEAGAGVATPRGRTRGSGRR